MIPIKLGMDERQEMRMRLLACRAVAGHRERGRSRHSHHAAHVPYRESDTSYGHDLCIAKLVSQPDALDTETYP